jgi:hypothetical protein
MHFLSIDLTCLVDVRIETEIDGLRLNHVSAFWIFNEIHGKIFLTLCCVMCVEYTLQQWVCICNNRFMFTVNTHQGQWDTQNRKENVWKMWIFRWSSPLHSCLNIKYIHFIVRGGGGDSQFKYCRQVVEQCITWPYRNRTSGKASPCYACYCISVR